LLSGFLAIGLLAVTACSGPSGGAAAPFAPPGGIQPSSPLARERVKVKEFSDLPVGTSSVSFTPSDITVGPDGAMWVTDQIDQDSGSNAVVRIATSGRRTDTFYFDGVTSEGSSLGGITTGPDDALWLTDAYNFEVLRLDLKGNYTRFPVGGFGRPVNIVTGPDKALWFTNQVGSASEVVRMTTKGTMTPYTVGGAPIDIAVGSDHALWFTDFSGQVGRITTRGKIIEYSKGISPGAEPYSIAPGPDGAMWFTELGGGRIGRITTAGKITEYSNGITPSEMPNDLAAGPDGAMWFTESELGQSSRPTESKIGRVTMQGAITEYSKINPSAGPMGIVKGLKGDLWFVEGRTNEVGRVRIQ
jgi:virginiamycin B lyase